jgi:hypothetical protein
MEASAIEYIEPKKSFSDTLFEGKTITDSSKKLYLANLMRLNGGQEIKNLNFLKDVDAIETKLNALKPNTRRTYIIAIVSLLKTLIEQAKYKKLYEKYYKILEALNAELKTSNEKTPKETENWLSQDAIKAKFETLKSVLAELTTKKISAPQYERLLNLVVLGLYVLQPPRRNLDYQDMNVSLQKCKTKCEDPPTVPTKASNMLNLVANQFEFNNFKTKGTYSTQIEPINEELRALIDIYLKYHPLAKEMKKQPVPFIVSHDGKPYTNNNDFTRLLYKIFDGQKVGVSMLRKIFLTDKYKDTVDEMQKDATSMGTSSTTIQDHYIKE